MSKGVSLASTVRIKEDVLFNDLQGEVVILELETGTYFGLDPVGSRAWQLIQEFGCLESVRDVMLQEFEVSAERLWEDLHALVTRLRESGLVEVIDENHVVE